MIRFFDIVISIITLVLLFPFLIVISLLIVMESKGGIFYKQIRVGQYGKDFFIYKFRTMFQNSDKQGLLTVGNHDARITRIGYLLRRYKIDEIPQFFNVLIGDMSIVGPRPEVRKYVVLYTEEQKSVLLIRPGITDYVSIKYRNENTLLDTQDNPEEYYIREILPDKLKYNLELIDNFSVKKYFHIIILTFKISIFH